MQEKRAKIFVGVDWAHEEHKVCVVDVEGKVLAERAVKHTGRGLEGLCGWLKDLSGGEPAAVWVAIEVPHGAVVETLVEHGLRVFSINPKQLDRFRDRFNVAGAKDDRLDARVLADSLRTDPGHFRAVQLQEPAIIELKEWSRMADDLKREHVRLSNQFRAQLYRYYPQILQVSDDVGAEWFLALWEKVPQPALALHTHPGTVDKIFKRHHIRRMTGSEALAILREPPIQVAPGVPEAAVAHLKMLAPRLHLVNEQLRECTQHLKSILDCLSIPLDGEENKGKQRDAAIIDSLPGVGTTVRATLFSEASEPIKQRNNSILRALCGEAPVTRQSGKSCCVRMRRACNPRLREALYHWSRVASQIDPYCRHKYARSRSRGHSHGRALRGIGDRLLNVMCAMLRDGTLYDPSRHQPKEEAQAA